MSPTPSRLEPFQIRSSFCDLEKVDAAAARCGKPAVVVGNIRCGSLHHAGGNFLAVSQELCHCVVCCDADETHGPARM